MVNKKRQRILSRKILLLISLFVITVFVFEGCVVTDYVATVYPLPLKYTFLSSSPYGISIFSLAPASCFGMIGVNVKGLKEDEKVTIYTQLKEGEENEGIAKVSRGSGFSYICNDFSGKYQVWVEEIPAGYIVRPSYYEVISGNPWHDGRIPILDFEFLPKE